MEITLVRPYDASWPACFARVKAFVEPALTGIAHTVEHVGSTSIAGMVAKPIIDLDIVIAAQDLAAVIERLTALGYVHEGDLGIPKREAFDLRDPQCRARLPEHHLYVCEAGAYELRKHLAFRDFMNQHPEWRERLSRLKQELCMAYANDRQAYIDGKSCMVQEITALAMAAPEQQ